MCTSTEGLRFEDSCALDLFNVCSSRGCLCLSEREFPCLAHYREMFNYVTSRRSSTRAAWLKASIRLFPNLQKTSVTEVDVPQLASRYSAKGLERLTPETQRPNANQDQA